MTNKTKNLESLSETLEDLLQSFQSKAMNLGEADACARKYPLSRANAMALEAANYEVVFGRLELKMKLLQLILETK